MSRSIDQGYHTLPGTKLHLIGILFGIGIYYIGIKLKQPSVGLFLGFLTWFIVNRWAYKIVIRKTLRRIEMLERAGDKAITWGYFTYAANRLSNSPELQNYRHELIKRLNPEGAKVSSESCATISVEAVVDSLDNDFTTSYDEGNETKVVRVDSVLSRFAIITISLIPFVFLPFNRQAFPHFGLWVPTVIGLFSSYLLFNPQKEWDKTIAKAGLSLSFVAFVLFALAMLSNGLTGPNPKWTLDLKLISPSWPVKALQFVVFLFSVIIHECAHGLCAYFVGDPTAKDHGRISLNPIRHIDLFGSIILPGIMMFVPGGVVFGWAKPVPVNPKNYRRPRRGNFVVSVAGVSANLLLALFFTSVLMTLGIVLHYLYPQMSSEGLMVPWRQVVLHGVPSPFIWVCGIELLKAGVYMNMILLSLNILPVPPLDGYGIIESIMPKAIQGLLAKFRAIGSWAFLALVMFNIIDYLLIPGILLAMLLLAGAGFAGKLG